MDPRLARLRPVDCRPAWLRARSRSGRAARSRRQRDATRGSRRRVAGRRPVDGAATGSAARRVPAPAGPAASASATAPPSDREPRPGEEHRPEVVAVDRARSRTDAANRQVSQRRDARQQRVAREADGRDRANAGTAPGSRAGPSWPQAERQQGVDLAGEVAERPREVALELAREDDVPEARSRSRGGRRRAAPGTGPPAAAARGRAARRRRSDAPRAARISRGRRSTPRLDREHEQRRSAGTRSSVSAWFAERDAEQPRRRATIARSARAGEPRVVRGRPRASPTSRSQRSSRPSDRDEQGDVERVGVRGDADRARRAASARSRAPRRRRSAAARRGGARRPPPVPAASATSRPTAGSSGTRARRAARGRCDASQPSSDVGREAGRVHRARAAAAPSGPRPCPTRRCPAGAWSGRPRSARSRHGAAATTRSMRAEPPGRLPAKELAPGDAPQVDQGAGDQQRDRDRPRPAVATPRRPERDQGQQERDEVEREPVAPLDPALAEVGEVEQRRSRRTVSPAPRVRRATGRAAGSRTARAAGPGALTAGGSCRCRPAWRAGSPGRTGDRVGARRRAQDDRRVEAQRVGLDVGERRRGSEPSMIAEVLGDVAEVLDRPVGVVAERRVAVGLELVLVVVARVEDGAGGEQRVAEQRGDGQRRRRRPPTEAGARASIRRRRRASKNGAANTSGSRAVAAMPEQQPGEDLRAVERPCRPPAG